MARPRRERLAERAGFEPAVLSHTAFRERHHQPLGHLSAREDSRGFRPGSEPTALADACGGEQLLGFVTADAADDPESTAQGRVIGELEDRAGGAIAIIRGGIYESLDVTAQHRADAHRARLDGREDGHVLESRRSQPSGRLAQCDDHGVGGGVTSLDNPLVPARDHRLIHHGNRGMGTLAPGGGGPGLGQRLAHVELVVHASDDTRAPSNGARMHLVARLPGCRVAGLPETFTNLDVRLAWTTMTRPRRIGILTGGGDVPGLNSVIKSVTYRASELGAEMIGIRRGWEGLTHGQPGAELDAEYLRRLDRANTRTIDRTGGTILHTSRTNPAKMPRKALPAWLDSKRIAGLQVGEDRFDLTPVVLEHIDGLGIDVLVTIGGDDTLSFSRILANQGVPLVAIPKTMDNDAPGTEYCIGFSSAITRAKELIDRQRTTLGSHERIGVFRIFGRDAGFSALFAAYVTSARCVIPEVRYDVAAARGDHRRGPSRIIRAGTRSWSPLRARSGRVRRSPSTDRPMHSGIGTRPTSARSWRVS